MPVITQEENRSHSATKILYDNRLTGSGLSAAEVVLTPNTWQRWESASGTMQSTFSLSAGEVVDSVAIGAHNLGSKGCTVVIETTTTTGSNYVQQANFIPQDDRAIFVSFEPVTGCEEIRLTITNGSNRVLGVVYAGQALCFERGIYGGHTPLEFAQVNEYRNNTSDTGNFLGRRIRRTGLKNMFMWSNIDDIFAREKIKPFKDSAVLNPFFIQWRPDFFPLECAFGYADSDIQVSNMSGVARKMQAQLNFIGYS